MTEEKGLAHSLSRVSVGRMYGMAEGTGGSLPWQLQGLPAPRGGPGHRPRVTPEGPRGWTCPVAAYPVSSVPLGRVLGANKAGSASSLFL